LPGYGKRCTTPRRPPVWARVGGLFPSRVGKSKVFLISFLCPGLGAPGPPTARPTASLIGGTSVLAAGPACRDALTGGRSAAGRPVPPAHRGRGRPACRQGFFSPG